MAGSAAGAGIQGNDGIAVSIVMPCLNEVQSLAHCIANAREALARIAADYGLAGEIVIADNGSTDGSQELAASLGARVVPVARKGYGAALIGGFDAAHGRYLVMGDADGSYDFTDSVAMIGRLIDGADLCMGSRFQGGIKPGAMPWKNRYIGNPALTGILNLFFHTGVDDAHCGLRAIRREAYAGLALESTGMEFASEMVIKASLKRLRIDQVPATLSPDLRGRAPHLRPWRDGWRHLRFLFMLSPTWAFGVPGLVLAGLGALILTIAALHEFGLIGGPEHFGVSWTILATFMVTTGHFALVMALATHVYGVAAGFRPIRPTLRRLERLLTLETALVAGGTMIACSLVGLAAVGVWWGANAFGALPTTLPLLLAIGLGVMGLQTALGGLLLSVLAGHQSEFTSPVADQPAPVRPRLAAAR